MNKQAHLQGAAMRRIAPVLPAGDAWYPVYLDVVETLRAEVPEMARLLTLTSEALAPTYEQLSEVGLVGGGGRAILRADIGPSDEAAIVQNQLATMAAQAVARLPEDACLELSHLDFWDPASLVFLDRLLKEATRCRIALRFDNSRVAVSRMPADAAERIVEVRGAGGRGGRPGPADDYLAISPHGLPLRVLETLGAGRSQIAAEFFGPDGEPVARLSASRRKSLLRAIDPESRARMHCAIYDAYGPTGWNYFRRGGHALRSGDPTRMRETYTCYVAGLLRSGYDFVYDLLVAMAPLLKGAEREAICICAARLAPRLARKHGRRMAVGHYLAALESQSDREDRVSSLHELSNLLANSRKPADLRASRRYYHLAFQELTALPEGHVREDLEIRLRNGVALLDYKAGNGVAALDHEKKALEIAVRLARSDETYGRWSEPLLRTNTSKLLWRLFGDGAGAVDQLDSISEDVDARTRFSKMQNLGRMHFELGNFAEARRYLADCLDERDSQASYAEEEELFDLCLVAVATYRSGGRVATAQLDRMVYLARVTKSQQAQHWIESLRVVLEEAVA